MRRVLEELQAKLKRARRVEQRKLNAWRAASSEEQIARSEHQAAVAYRQEHEAAIARLSTVTVTASGEWTKPPVVTAEVVVLCSGRSSSGGGGGGGRSA